MNWTVIHATDPTTRMLSQLYERREDIAEHITEVSTNGAVRRAIARAEAVMMLGHGTSIGLFSVPVCPGRWERRLVDSSHVQQLRGKPCIAIWCHANEFAETYKLHGLFSGMIISELQEAVDEHIAATKEEIDTEIWKFARRLRECIDRYDLCDVPARMLELDDVHSPLTVFNYNNLFYYE